MIKILSFGHDKFLLAQRHRYLSGGQIEVASVESREDAIERLEAQEYDAVVIGHRVPQEIRNEVADLAKAKHKARIIFLYRNGIVKADTADAVLRVDGDPDFLVEIIQRLVNMGKARSVKPAAAI